MLGAQVGVKTRRGTFDDPDRSFGRESRSLKGAYELYEVQSVDWKLAVTCAIPNALHTYLTELKSNITGCHNY